jgi:hypothetical protein
MRRRIYTRVPSQSIARFAEGRGRSLVALAFAALLTLMPLVQGVAAAEPSAPPMESPSASPSVAPVVPPASALPSAAIDPTPSEVALSSPTSGVDTARPGVETVIPDTPDTPTTTNFTYGSWSAVRTEPQSWSYAVAPAPPGGTVSLEVDGAAVDSSSPNPTSGAGVVSWTPASIGTHQLQLVYGGTAGFAASSSPTFPAEVSNPAPSSVTIEASVNPTPRATDVTFTATVTPNPGSGSIEWHDESGLLATVALDDAGTAQYTTAYATTGSHQLWAIFPGNTDWSSGWSNFSEQVVGDTVALTLSVPSNPMPVGDVVVTATVTPNPGSGTVRFSEGFAVLADVAVDENGQALLDLGTRQAGYVRITGEFLGNDTYDHATANVDIVVWNTSSVSLATNRTTATAGELPVVLTATVPKATGYPGEQTSFDDTVGGVTVTLGPVAINQYLGTASLSTNALRVGVHTITAHYQPGANTLTFDAFSAPITVTVAADKAVHVTFAPSLATFYAYKDGFRDTVSLGGVLDERATVTIKVYSGTGSIKRSWSLGWKAAGKYSVAWNGRTAAGTALPAGKYKVVASFKDARGNVRSIAGYTTISWRKAVWKSVTVVKYGDAGSYSIANGGAIYYSNDYSHGRILDSGDMIRDCVGCGWAAGKFVFTVASTSVLDYRYLYVEVRGHGFSDRDHTGTTSLVNPTTLALGAQMANCIYDEVGTTCGIPTSKSYISSTHRITALVWMTQAWGDAYDLRYLKLTYQYAVWA